MDYTARKEATPKARSESTVRDQFLLVKRAYKFIARDAKFDASFDVLVTTSKTSEP